MRWNHFGGTLLFAALASLGFPAARLIFDPVLGSTLATQFYLLGTASLYGLCIAASPRRGLASAGFIALLGSGLMLGNSTTSELALGLAVAIALARSALLYRARVVRSVAIELALTLGGLLLARYFAAPGLLGGAFGLWGYLLVQCVYFPLAGSSARRREPAGDAFDEARSRLRSLLRDSEC